MFGSCTDRHRYNWINYFWATMPDDYAPGDEYNTDKNEFKKTGYRDDPTI